MPPGATSPLWMKKTVAGKTPVITVDGPGGSGKGMVATHLAGLYGYHLLDSGALYRLVGLVARRAGCLDEENIDESRLAKLATTLAVSFSPTGNPENPLTIMLSDEDVTSAVRTDEAGVDASRVAALAGVRERLFSLQQSFRKPPGLVADGRDMGTVVFRDAKAKIFLTASVQARAERRYNQLKHKGMGANLHALFQSIQARDERDRNREVSPLRPAEDACVIDSTDMGIEEVLDHVVAIVAEKLGR